MLVLPINYIIEERKMKLITTLLVLAFAFTLSACNTVEGAGKDIQKGGEAIEDAAK
jgi:predicted small secreted protein